MEGKESGGVVEKNRKEGRGGGREGRESNWKGNGEGRASQATYTQDKYYGKEIGNIGKEDYEKNGMNRGSLGKRLEGRAR